MAHTHVIDFRQDVHYALRLLRRTPAFTAVAVATLALGIGGSAAMFTIVNSVVLRPLSFPEPEQLMVIRPGSGARVSAAYFRDWRLDSDAFEGMAAWHDVRANVTGLGAPLEMMTDRVTTNFFTVLGTPPLLGRTFSAGATLSDVEPEVVLSYGFWQRQFGGNPDVVGTPITLDDERFTIIGVMPQRFAIRTNELAESRAELWMPLRLVVENRIGMGGILNVVGRLAADATREQAQAQLTAISRRIEEQHPSYSRNWGLDVAPLHDATIQKVRLRLLVLFGAVGILLLIACANVANLVLSRIATRQTEFAIRLSLGATTSRVVRQLLTESLMLATVSGTLGVLLAVWGTQALVSVLPPSLQLPRASEISVDVRMVAFSIIVTILTALLFGLLPTLSSARSTPQSTLRDAARGSSAGPRWKGLGSALVVSEVALAIVLLAGAGLLGRSFWELSHVEPGFATQHVLTLRTTLPAARYDTDDRIRVFVRGLLDRVQNLPGVSAVGFANYLPMTLEGGGGPFEIEGRPALPHERPGSWRSIVGGRYFEAMRIPLLRGRLFDDSDTENTQPVFVIDEALANQHWPNANPIGARLKRGRPGNQVIIGEVIGVVGSVRWAGLAKNPQGTMYSWFPQEPIRQLAVVVQTSADPIAMARLVGTQVAAIDPNQPVADIRAMRDFVSDDLAASRFTLWLLGGFAVAALLLAAIGLYGVIAFNVTQRTREIGVRVALGAERRDVLRLVIRRGMLLTATGLAIGIAAALALSRVMTGLLYGVSPTDPVTLVSVALFLGTVALLATYLPARQAAHVDPMAALRAE